MATSSELNSVDVMLAEIYLPTNKQLAYTAFDQLWSRRTHPYTIESGGSLLAKAGKLLQDAGDRDYARRMYMAAIETKLPHHTAQYSLQKQEINIPEGLQQMGFAQDAQRAEQRFDEAKVLNEHPDVVTLRRDGNDVELELDAQYLARRELAALLAQGYDHFKNPLVADRFRNEIAAWDTQIQEKAQSDAAYERHRQAQLARQQAKSEEGSTFMTFVSALSGGLQAYARARQSDAASAQQTSAALAAAGQQFTSSNPGEESVMGMMLTASSQAIHNTQGQRTATMQTVSSSSSSSDSSATRASHTKTYRTAVNCVVRDRTSSHLSDYLGNNCDFPINVKWVTQEGPCRNGCMDGLKANQARSSVTKEPGSGAVHAACESPATPKNPDGSHWLGGQQYMCTR